MTQMFNVLTIAFKNTPTRGHQFLVWFYIVTKRECQCLMLYKMTSISNFPNIYISLRNMIYQMWCQILIHFLYKGFSHCNFHIYIYYITDLRKVLYCQICSAWYFTIRCFFPAIVGRSWAKINIKYTSNRNLNVRDVTHLVLEVFYSFQSYFYCI